MAKITVTRRTTRQRKVVKEKEDGVDTGDQTECLSEPVLGTEENSPSKSSEAEIKQMEGDQDEQDAQMTSSIEVKGNTPTVTVTWKKKKSEEGGGNHVGKETNGSGQMAVGNKKRKTKRAVETSPPKKTKLINDGFCLFVGNLNNSKKFDELKNSLANYLMTQSLLFQDIRLDQSKNHAFVDLASEMDLTKALTLNGETFLDKRLTVSKAKVQSEDEVKVKTPPLNKKAEKDARCLFVKNLPYTATKEDIKEHFPKAIAIRFPGGAESPSHGIAFLEFQNKAIAQDVLQGKQGAEMEGRILIVDCVGERNVPKADEADKKNRQAEISPNNTLFVSKLSSVVKKQNLKKLFQKAVKINIPEKNGKPRGFAFVEFATVEDAEQALKSSQNIKLCKKAIRVQFCETRAKPEEAKVPSKTLIVVGLTDKTTGETLKNAFEGALDARVVVDKETGLSKRFGFVEFESEEICTAAKEAMEDCVIDGNKVTLDYAKSKGEKGPQGARGGLAGCPSRRSAGPGAGRGGKRRGAATSQDAAKKVKRNN
ncbi:nucleolin-like [Mugil cephalus]|uniref:nucleolin-like n=1 Tax=Mugil cephalus TaxID=48193 RepID=UPI001FB6F653|nr:nucleolin-like [Mugil cephalus]